MIKIVIYIINLKRRKDRLEKVLKTVSIIKNINISIIEAIDKNNLNESNLKINILDIFDKHHPYKNDQKDIHISPTELRTGQIACILSHLKTWNTFINTDYDYALILEDDIQINKEYFNKIFEDILNEIPKIDFDLLYLGRNNLQFNGFYKGEEINKYFYKPLEYGRGTHSYILSRKGAEIIIKYYTRNECISLNNHPLDNMIGHEYLIKHFLNIDIKILSILPCKYYNSDIIIESFSTEFLFYPENHQDSDT
jgi:glycosyl transferase family 25